MLHHDQPRTWRQRMMHASLLLVGLAVAAHLIDTLLLPLLPTLFTVLVGGALILTLLQRRRW